MTVKELSELSSLSFAARELAKDDSTHPSYLDSLEKQELYQDAIRYLAYKLTPNAGVKWANRCFRELQDPALKGQKDEPLEASERWAAAPDDTARFAAKKTVDNPKNTSSSKLIAMAVYFSGGSLSPPGSPEVPAPQYAAQKMVAGSVVNAVISYEPHNSSQRYKRALAMGKELDVA